MSLQTSPCFLLRKALERTPSTQPTRNVIHLSAAGSWHREAKLPVKSTASMRREVSFAPECQSESRCDRHQRSRLATNQHRLV